MDGTGSAIIYPGCSWPVEFATGRVLQFGSMSELERWLFKTSAGKSLVSAKMEGFFSGPCGPVKVTSSRSVCLFPI